VPDTDTRAVLIALGANIARLRKKGGLTQAALAERLGCEPSFVQKLEYGDGTPSLPMLVRIAKQFGVKVGVLFRDAKPAPVKKGRPPKKRGSAQKARG
jgi:transcriptional regulator with XRE-family HTH domain